MLLIVNAKQVLTLAEGGFDRPRRGVALGNIGLKTGDFCVLIQGEKIVKTGPYKEIRSFIPSPLGRGVTSVPSPPWGRGVGVRGPFV